MSDDDKKKKKSTREIREDKDFQRDFAGASSPRVQKEGLEFGMGGKPAKEMRDLGKPKPEKPDKDNDK